VQSLPTIIGYCHLPLETDWMDCKARDFIKSSIIDSNVAFIIEVNNCRIMTEILNMMTDELK